MKDIGNMIILGGIAGSGWDQFKFITTPDELEEMLEPLNFLIFKSGLVEKDYKFSKLSEPINDYRNYWTKITSGTSWIPSLDNNLFARFLLTDNQNDIEFQDYHDPRYKILKESRPIIFLETFQVYYHDFKLSTNDFYPEGNIGLNLIYPKIFCYLNNGQLTEFEKTDLFSTKYLFSQITEIILRRTKKLIFRTEEKVIRPNIYISDRAKIELSKNYYLNSKGLKIR